MKPVVLYAIGSPLVVDVEEACLAAGLEILAGIRNVDAPVFVSGAVRVVELAAADPRLRACPIAVGLFTPAHRKRAVEEARGHGFAASATLVHPSSPVARSAELGSGVFVNAGCVIAGACRIAAHVLVNRSASIGHHAEIGEYAAIGPGVTLAGMIRIGRGAMIGAGSILLPEVEIGDNSVIAPGSVVRRSIPANSLAEGSPARVVREVAGYKGLGV